MSVSFPYDFVGDSPFGPVHRPIAKVTFYAPKNPVAVDVWMVVDTGADFSILPRLVSEKLRVSLEHDCVKDVTHGVGGEQSIFFCKKKIRAKIGEMKLDVPLAFFDSNEVPALLGRLGFLETLDVCFLKNHTVSFEE